MDKEVDVVRAWKDEEYRNSRTPEQIAKLPPNPAGEVELGEADLDYVSGGFMTGTKRTFTQPTAAAMCCLIGNNPVNKV
jgi:mersacidin/lichenicidin family type 2 lantibiotic